MGKKYNSLYTRGQGSYLRADRNAGGKQESREAGCLDIALIIIKARSALAPGDQPPGKNIPAARGRL